MFFVTGAETKIVGKLSGASALSGLAVVKDTVYLIADNREELIRLPLAENNFEKQISGKNIEKKYKSDLESLFYDGARDRLFALPSGSTPIRRTGYIFNVEGDLTQKLDVTPLYAQLADKASLLSEDFNIEGSALLSPCYYVLLNRGNGPNRRNGLWTFHSENFPMGIEDIEWRDIALPCAGKVPLQWTDCTVEGETLYFSAAAEDTTSSYDDGAIVASGIGALDLSTFSVVWFARLTEPHKIEGIELLFVEATRYVFRCCTDPDSDTLPGLVLEIEIPKARILAFSR